MKRTLQRGREPPFFACASTVSISEFSQLAARVIHANLGRPSIRTVQAPHSPLSQPFFTLVSACLSRR